MHNYLQITNKIRSIDFGHIIASDTEAYRFSDNDNEIQEFYNIGFYDGSEYIVNNSKGQGFSQMLKYVNKYKIITILFHNLTYDMQILGLMTFILDKKFYFLPLKRAILGNVNYISFGNKNMTINFLDTTNYFHYKLSDMAKSMGMTKLNEENYTLKPEKWNQILEIEGNERVKVDCKILYDYFMQFLSNKDYAIGITAASTSFRTYKRDFLQDTITLPSDHIIPSLQSYRGGRCEPYVINKEPVKLIDYDINSLYPFVMKNNPYSVKFRREISGINFDKIENQEYNYLYNVDYSYSDQPDRLPIMVRNTHTLTQSYSATDVWLTSQEILAMYKQSDSILFRMRQGFEYHNDYIFTDFVDKFYGKRLIANAIEKQFIKLILNSLYGKFGQHQKITEFIPITDIDPVIQSLIGDNERVKINGMTYTVHDKYVTVQTELPEHSYNNPLIASEITANARLYNFYIQQQIGFKHIYYTDTDSFFSNREWLTGDKLGQLKIEKQGLFYIFNPKHYAYYDGKNWLITLKGINQSKSKKFTDLQLIEYNQSHNTNYVEIYNTNQFSTLKSNKEIGNVRVNQVVKGITLNHDKLRYVREGDDLIGLPFFKVIK